MTRKRRYYSYKEQAKNQRRTLYMFLLCAFIFVSSLSGWVLADSGVDSVTVIVDSGDTLWEICEPYAPENMDIRDFIAKVKYVNKLPSSNLEIGTELVIPLR